MGKLVIDTKKSIYKPIEVVIDGQVYHVNRITRPVIIELDALAKQALKGDVEAAYKQLALLLGKHKALDELDLREVNDVINYITKELFTPEKSETPEKKASGPGGSD